MWIQRGAIGAAVTMSLMSTAVRCQTEELVQTHIGLDLALNYETGTVGGSAALTHPKRRISTRTAAFASARPVVGRDDGGRYGRGSGLHR